MKIVNKVLIYVSLVVLSIILIFQVYYGLQQFNSNQITSQTVLQFKLNNIYKQLDILTQKNLTLEKTINNLPNKIIMDKVLLERKLKFISVAIKNKTMGWSGTGVSFKYKDNYYVLSAGHMINAVTDKIMLNENDQDICELEVVKWHFDNSIDAPGDLLLLRPKDKSMKPTFYAELAGYAPEEGSEIYIVGNPMDIEDVISDGRLIQYEEYYVYYIDHTYFGNSGGGVYNKQGELIGIVSHIIPIQPKKAVPPYMIAGAVNLMSIREFLEGVE
jgi:S1-C subfamily serine protease